jgi:hypothetical protein
MLHLRRPQKGKRTLRTRPKHDIDAAIPLIEPTNAAGLKTHRKEPITNKLFKLGGCQCVDQGRVSREPLSK